MRRSLASVPGIPGLLGVVLAGVVAGMMARAPAAESAVTITEADGYRIITANGIPDHSPGRFPNRNNPNAIAPQQHRYRVPLTPVVARRLVPVGLNTFGVAVNGVPFDPGAAEWYQRNPRSGWQVEALGGLMNLGLDQHHAHVQPTGAYHYHGVPTGLVAGHAHPGQMQLLGWAADGYPIYHGRAHQDPWDATSPVVAMRPSYRLRAGTRAGGPGGPHDGSYVQDWEFVQGLGDLDLCNGRSGVTPEFPQGVYYYMVTAEFPFIPRYWAGVPDQSFIRGGRGSARPPPRR